MHMFVKWANPSNKKQIQRLKLNWFSAHRSTYVPTHLSAPSIDQFNEVEQEKNLYVYTL